MITEELKKILEDLERRDSYSTLKLGMPPDVEREIGVLCAAYRSATAESRDAMRSAITRKATVLILSFASRMATLAMQRKDKEAVDLGLVALDLSNAVNVNSRDVLGQIAQLAFAAKECGVEVSDRAAAVVPEFSPQLLEMLKHPGLVRVVQDKQGKRVFWSPSLGHAK
jgi:hypothetical protein